MRTFLLGFAGMVTLALALVVGYRVFGEADLIRGLFYGALIVFVGGVYWLFRFPR